MNQAAGPSAGTVGTVELEHAVSPAVSADRILHGLILLHRGFGKLQAELQRFYNVTVSVTVRVLDKLSDILLSEGIHLHTMIREPLLHLNNAVWVIKICDILHGQHEFGF